MPVYNTAAYLRESVESVLTQTYTNLELIAADDRSTDDSLEILEEFAERDPRVKVLRLEHGGISATRNAALRAAGGEYVANLDSDDVALPDRLARQVAYLQANPDCLALGGRLMFIDSDGWPICRRPVLLNHEEIDAALLTGVGLSLPQTTAMSPRRAFEIVGGYDPEANPSEDIDLYLRMAEHGRLANLPSVLVRMRRHLASTSHRLPRKGHYELRQKVLQSAYARRRLTGSPTIAMSAQNLEETDYIDSWIAMASRDGYYRTARKYLARRLANTRPWQVYSIYRLVRTMAYRRLPFFLWGQDKSGG
jgi:glycosyltransferase involved in cell wall biosynthesis